MKLHGQFVDSDSCLRLLFRVQQLVRFLSVLFVRRAVRMSDLIPKTLKFLLRAPNTLAVKTTRRCVSREDSLTHHPTLTHTHRRDTLMLTSQPLTHPQLNGEYFQEHFQEQLKINKQGAFRSSENMTVVCVGVGVRD